MIIEKYESNTGEEKEAYYGCEYCKSPIQRMGEDGIDVCEECGIAEGFNNGYYDCDTQEQIEI